MINSVIVTAVSAFVYIIEPNIIIISNTCHNEKEDKKNNKYHDNKVNKDIQFVKLLYKIKKREVDDDIIVEIEENKKGKKENELQIINTVDDNAINGTFHFEKEKNNCEFPYDGDRDYVKGLTFQKEKQDNNDKEKWKEYEANAGILYHYCGIRNHNCPHEHDTNEKLLI